ncbi:MarR family winged helix-turn-helix transcriptional regulator [Amycolatopsis sp. NPDC054798]
MNTDGGRPLHETSAFKLMVLGTDLAADFAEHFREAELTPKHLGTLAMVDQGLARTQDDIARLMRVSPSLVVRMADHLEQRGLLERSRDPANRRKHILSVTAAGKSVLGEAASYASAVDNELEPRLGRQLNKILTHLMGKLVKSRQQP